MYNSAIIVLGCGINAEGNLSPDAEQSVRIAIEAIRNPSTCLIMSGYVSYKADFKPSISEAQAMKDYAIRHGVESNRVFVETESKDSLGNFVFTRLNVLEPLDIVDIRIVRGPNQSDKRIGYIADKVLGSKYMYNLLSAGTKRPEEAQREQKSLDVLKEWLEPIDDGDVQAIYRLLRQKHPGYNSTVSIESLTKLL